MKVKKKLRMKQKRALFGFLLATPFIIGFLLFFLQPLIQSTIYSFNNIVALSNGGINYEYVGLKHFFRAVTGDAEFRDYLLSNIQNLVSKVPMIVIYSLFIANILNRNFRGRNISRIIFFLPVIITSGVMIFIESSDFFFSSSQGSAAGQVSDAVSQFSAGNVDLTAILMSVNLDPSIMKYITIVINNFYEIIIASGVQITLLLAALQSIPKSLYEASSIEGATAWEDFWKITLPMVSPYVFLCTIYSIIDSFTNSTSGLMKYILDASYKQLDYGYSSAMVWIYFIIISVLLLIIGGISMGSKLLFSYDK